MSRQDAVEQTATALASGDVVGFPTETVYGIGAHAGNEAALERLASLAGSNGIHSTLHASSKEIALDGLPIRYAVHQRLLDKLLPGPVRFEIQQPPEVIADYVARHGIIPGACDDGSAVAIRVPSHPVGRRVLEAADVPVVAERLGVIVGVIDDRRPTFPDEIVGLDLLLDDGPTPIGKASTTIRLLENGGFDFGRIGAIDQEAVMGVLERTIVFVCTGNTCRSPMAEAIARSLVAAQKPNGITTHIVSAGVAAGGEMPATAEAIHAVHELGHEFHDHRSQPLTRAIIDRADAIFAMTPTHLETVLAMEPEAADRAWTLDPAGAVPDPIGGDQSLYLETARRIESLVRTRLEEMLP